MNYDYLSTTLLYIAATQISRTSCLAEQMNPRTNEYLNKLTGNLVCVAFILELELAKILVFQEINPWFVTSLRSKNASSYFNYHISVFFGGN